MDRTKRVPIGLGELLIADFEEARRLIGTFDVFSKVVKTPRFSAEKCSLGNAFEGLASFLDLAANPRKAGKGDAPLGGSGKLVAKNVQLLPHLRTYKVAHRPRILPRRRGCISNGRRVAAIAYIESENGLRCNLFMAFEKSFAVGIENQNTFPVGAVGLVARIGFIDVENARDTFGALQVAPEPEDIRSKSCDQIRQEPKYP